MPNHRQYILEIAIFLSAEEEADGWSILSSYPSAGVDVVRTTCGCQQLIRGNCMYPLLCVSCFCVYSPDPLTGHISGICPKAQQRPVSQQHCILVYWPFSSAAQRPLARAEKQVPIRWSEGRGDPLTQLDNRAWQQHKSKLKRSPKLKSVFF